MVAQERSFKGEVKRSKYKALMPHLLLLTVLNLDIIVVYIRSISQGKRSQRKVAIHVFFFLDLHLLSQTYILRSVVVVVVVSVCIPRNRVSKP